MEEPFKHSNDDPMQRVFTLDCMEGEMDVTCHANDDHEKVDTNKADAEKKNKLNVALGNLRIDTRSLDANYLDAERYFKEANRFHEKLRPQPLDNGFDEWLQEQDRACEEMLVKCMTPKEAHKNNDNTGDCDEEAYRGQKQLFEEMKLMDLRRVEQEKEIQDLIMREKEYATQTMKSICNYLMKNLKLKKLAEEKAKQLRREAREKVLANMILKNNSTDQK